jgi:hypothetical protein
VASLAGCGGDEAPESTDQRYLAWKTASFNNVKIFYPAYHIHADKMSEFARLYARQIAVDCRLLQIPVPAETLVVYHYTGFGQGREMTGREYPFAEDSVIHFWTPSHRGTTIMQYLLPKWINKEPSYRFLKHGLISLMDASGQSYHRITWDMVQDSTFIPLVELATDSTVDSNLERRQSAEGASFCDYILVKYGVKGLAYLYRAESPIELAAPGILGLSVDSLQSEWLRLVEQVVAGRLPKLTADSADGSPNHWPPDSAGSHD